MTVQGSSVVAKENERNAAVLVKDGIGKCHIARVRWKKIYK